MLRGRSDSWLVIRDWWPTWRQGEKIGAPSILFRPVRYRGVFEPHSIVPVRDFVSSSFVQKKARGESRASSRKLRKGASSERSSEHSPRRRTRLFSYLDPSRSKDFALSEYVMFS